MLKWFNILLLSTISKPFTLCGKSSEQYFSIMQNTTFSIQKSQNRKSYKMEFRPKFAFQFNNVYFIWHAEQTSICNKKCMKYTVGQTSE